MSLQVDAASAISVEGRVQEEEKEKEEFEETERRGDHISTGRKPKGGMESAEEEDIDEQDEEQCEQVGE